MSTISASATQDQFLTLLVTQLQHQDPIEPVKQENFLAQLAQFATLEGVETLNTSFDQMLKLQELTQGSNLIGKSVVYSTEADPTARVGLVEEVASTESGISLLVSGEVVPLDLVTSVAAPEIV